MSFDYAINYCHWIKDCQLSAVGDTSAVTISTSSSWNLSFTNNISMQ